MSQRRGHHARYTGTGEAPAPVLGRGITTKELKKKLAEWLKRRGLMTGFNKSRTDDFKLSMDGATGERIPQTLINVNQKDQ